jgi:hypothetical protein
MKQHLIIPLVMTVLFSFWCFVSPSAGSQKIQPAPATVIAPVPGVKPVKCMEPPEVQVVNNAGISIFQVKVGKTVFHENLSACFDGCSTGFLKVSAGYHPVDVKLAKTASWVNIGSLGPFEGCLKYAVNIVKKGNTVCAELYVRKNTNPPFNNDVTRKKIHQVCKPMTLSPALTKTAAPAAGAVSRTLSSPGMAAPSPDGTAVAAQGQMRKEFPRPVIEDMVFKRGVENPGTMMTTAQIQGMGGGSADETVPLIRAEYGQRLLLDGGFTTRNVQSLQVRMVDRTGSFSNVSYGDPREMPEDRKQYRFQTSRTVTGDDLLTLQVTGTTPGPGGMARAEKQVRIESKRPVLEVRQPAVNDGTREVTFRVANRGDMAFPSGDVRLSYTIKGMPGNEEIARNTARLGNISVPRNQTVDIGTITLPESAIRFDRIDMEITVAGMCHTIFLPDATGRFSHTWQTHTFPINDTLLSILNALFSGYVRINTFGDGYGDRSSSQPYVANDSRLVLTAVDPTAAGGTRTVFDQLIPITSYKFGSDGVEALVLIHNLEAPITGTDLFFIRDGKLGLRIVFDCSARNEIKVWARDAIAKVWRANWLPDLDLIGFSIELMLTPVQNGQEISYSDLTMNARVNLDMPGHRVERWLEREAASMIEDGFAPVFDNADVRTTIENTFRQMVTDNPMVNIRHLVSVRGAGNSIVITYR